MSTDNTRNEGMLRVEQACLVWLVLVGLVGVALVVVFS